MEHLLGQVRAGKQAVARLREVSAALLLQVPMMDEMERAAVAVELEQMTARVSGMLPMAPVPVELPFAAAPRPRAMSDAIGGPR